MQYDDFKTISPDDIEEMAREYNSSLLGQGFMFVKIDENEAEKKSLKNGIFNSFKIAYSYLDKLLYYSNISEKQRVLNYKALSDDIMSKLKILFEDFSYNNVQVALGNIEVAKNKIINNFTIFSLNTLNYKKYTGTEEYAIIDEILKNSLKLMQILSN